jgi:putative phosphoribosyl transferase
VGAAELTRVERRERAALRRRTERFRAAHPRLNLAGRTVVVVAEMLDGVPAARAACLAAYAYGAIRVVVAAPIATRIAAAALATDADKVVTLHLEDDVDEPGRYYQYWAPFGDDEICAALDAAATTPPTSCSQSEPVHLAV